MAKKVLRLHCAAIDADTIEFDADEQHIHVDIVADNGDGFDLNVATARELFNWLGVWLHTR